LEERLQDARSKGARMILIATDGVFSMDGTVAPLKYETILLVIYLVPFSRLLFLKSKVIDPSQKTYLFNIHYENSKRPTKL